MKALVIDDSRAMRGIVSRILKSCGFETAAAGDGQEGLDWLAENGPADVAMVDWNMPVMDGLSFVIEARSNPAYAGMKIIMCTTESEIERIQQAIEAGADEYLMKPFTALAVVEKLGLVGVQLD